MKKCKCCNNVLPLDNYYKDDKVCKSCRISQKMERDRKDPDSGKFVVYVMKSGDSNFYKIGVTTYGVTNRRNKLQQGNPEKIVVVKKLYYDTYDEMRTAERELHKIYSERRYQGEWFKLSSFEVDKLGT